MEVRAAQGSSAQIGVIDQLNRLSIGTQGNGQNSSGLRKYENMSNHRKEFHEVQSQYRRTTVNAFVPKAGETDDKNDLMKPGEMVKNRWRILQKIGGGGFGEIYQAIDTQFEQGRSNRNNFDTSEFCSSCAVKAGLNLSPRISAVNNTNMRVDHCASCGREYYSSTSKAGLQRQSSEDALESVDSGNSSGYSERSSTLDNQIVAVKAESNTQSKQMLHMEVAVMRKLKGKKNFCDLLACGKTHCINYIVMTLQGKNLSELRKRAVNRSFGRSTSLRIVCKCLDALQELHSMGYLHRDIKPSNFCLRRDDPSEICLLDFGLVRPYLKPGTTNQMRPPRSTAGFRGTVRYASLNAHNYRELGRHDDLWSMYYMLVEFLSGQLPWHRKSDKELAKKIKSETCPIKLGVSAGLPQIIATTWVNHLNSLNYFTTPNYRELRQVIESWLSANGIEWNEPFDWQRQAMTRAESTGTFAPMFKRNQPSGRQFVQNSKRPTYQESTGCLKRLDKRGFGSSIDLKRAESEGVENGRSTAALCEDAVTNKNAATEKIMQDDENGNFEDASEKLDGKDKIMGSHIDLAAIAGGQRKPTQNADRQFTATPKVLVRPTIEAAMKFQTPPPNKIFDQPFSQTPPPVPPHRAPVNHDNGLVLIHPENRPLLPPLYSLSPPPIPSHNRPEDLQKRAIRLPPALRQRKGLSDMLVGKIGSINNVLSEETGPPTPKPRNRHTENEESGMEIEERDRPGRWLCRDDMGDGYKPALLTSPYVQRSKMQAPPNCPQSNRYSRQYKGPSAQFISTEHLPDVQPSQKESGSLQKVRSMTALHDAAPDPNFVKLESNAWLPVHDGRTRSVPLVMVPNTSFGDTKQEVIRRPFSQDNDARLSSIWPPIKFEQVGYASEIGQLMDERGEFIH